MKKQHKSLTMKTWAQKPLCEQMANIGSEISRALNWQKKEKTDISRRAVIRALELIDLSISSSDELPRIKEFTRLRETVIDYFYGKNEFSSSEKSWRGYFDHFNYALRKGF